MGTRTPAVVAANAHLDRIDVDGDLALVDEIPLVLGLLERSLRIRPRVETDGRAERGDLDGLAVAVGELER